MTEDHEPQQQEWTLLDTFAVAFFLIVVICLVAWVFWKLTEI